MMSVSNQDRDAETLATQNQNSPHKVLIFPKRAPRRQLLRYSLSLSLATVFLVSLFINQIQLAIVQKEIHILAGEKTSESNRIPANISPEEATLIMKEQALAAKLKSNSTKIIGSDKVRDIDQLVYGTLEGKYRPQLEKGLLKSLQLSSHVSPVDGHIISDKINFLLNSREVLGRSIHSVSLVEKGEGFEVFELRDSVQASQGKVRFLQDEVGHITSIEFF